MQNAVKPTPTAIGGKGVYLTIRDNTTGEIRTILDTNSGAAVSSIGHGDEEIRQAMKDAVDNVIYTFPSIAGNEASEKLAQFLIDESKGTFSAAIFTGSGSESVENAMKIIRKYHYENGEPQRVKFISRKQSYHGFTIGAFSLGDNNRKLVSAPILLPPEQTPKVSQVYPYRNMLANESLEEYKDRLLTELDEAFQAASPDTVCAFVAETVTGSTFGCQTPPPGYLDGCREICHKYGALFFLDEVMSGCGRMGSFHAWEKYMEGPGPDIQTNGKTLGAGYVSIASVLIGTKIMDLFKAKNAALEAGQTYHSHSFNCEVALKVQEKVKRDGLIENISKVGAYLGEQLEALNHNLIGEVRGSGGFWAIEFVKDKSTKEPFDPEYDFGGKFSKKFFDNGAYSLTSKGSIDGKRGEHTVFSPAFSITKEEVDTIVSLVKKTLDELEAELP